jgi:hypothetical protein
MPRVSPGGSISGGATSSATTTEQVPGGVIVRDASGNIVKDTRGIINETGKAQAEAQLIAASPAPVEKNAQAFQSAENIRAANLLLPELYAYKEGKAKLPPGMTYQEVLTAINTLETARAEEARYSGVPATYGGQTPAQKIAAEARYEAEAARLAQPNPVLLASLAAPIDLQGARGEAVISSQLAISEATGLPVGAIRGNYFTGEEYAIKTNNPASYINLTEQGISQAERTGRGFVPGVGTIIIAKPPPTLGTVTEYYAELRPGLAPEELSIAVSGLAPSAQNTEIKDLSGFTPKEVGKIIAVTSTGGKEVAREEQPYNIYVKDVPVPASAVMEISPNNVFTDIDQRTMAAGASVEAAQEKLENITGLHAINKFSDTTSRGIDQFRDSLQGGTIGTYGTKLGLTFLSGAAQLPKILIKAQELTIKTAVAAVGVGQYVQELSPYHFPLYSNLAIPAPQAESIAARSRGALSEYYSTLENPTFYVQTAGMVALPFIIKGGYNLARETVGVPEVARIELAPKEVRQLPTMTGNREMPVITKGVETAPASGYTGVFFVRGTKATPLLGAAEGKIVLGEPSFKEPPINAFNAEIRAEPKATAIAEKATQDFAARMGLPEQADIYRAYRFAARETYPYAFEVKTPLREVLAASPDKLGNSIYEFIKQDKDVSGVSLSEVKGSTAQASQMGIEEFRGGGIAPQDVDIRRVNPEEGAQKLMEFPPFQAALKERGLTARAMGANIELLNPETGQFYHRVQFLPKEGVAGMDTAPAAFNQPEYVGFGLKEKPYMEIAEGIRVQQLGEQGARKASAGLVPRETGEFAGERGRSIYVAGGETVFFKDIADATDIFRFASEEKGRPDIFARIAEALPLMSEEQRKAARAFLPKGYGTLEYSITRQPRGEAAGAAPFAASSSRITKGELANGEKGANERLKEIKKAYSEPFKYEEPKAYADYGYGSASSPYAGASPSAYRAASPYRGSASSSAGAASYVGSAPSISAPASPYEDLAPSGAAALPRSPSASPYKAPSVSNYLASLVSRSSLAPSSYRGARPSQASMTSSGRAYPGGIREIPPPPPPTMPPLGKPVGADVLKKLEMEPAPELPKEGRRSIYADLLSVQISENRYGLATSPNPRIRSGVFKYEANTLGYVPTVEMINRGEAKEKAPRVPRVLIPKRLRKGG